MVHRMKEKLPAITVSLFSALYISSMLYISFLKYYTFHADFVDLGTENQIFWLLSHGYLYQFLHLYHYGAELQKPILFIILPLYYVFPSPYLLITLETVALGLIPLPIYFLSVKFTGSKWFSAILASLSIFYFPLVSANLFDFHMMTFSPVLYLSMAASWALGKRKLMILFAALSAMTNSLVLLMVIFFLVYAIYIELKDRGIKATRSLVAVYSAAIAVLMAVILVYTHFGLYTSGAAPPGVPISSVTTFGLSSKIELFIYLFGNTGFVPLLEPWTLFFMLPFIGFVFLSSNVINYTLFGLMFPVLSAGPMFLGLVLAVSKLVKWSGYFKDYEERFSLKSLIRKAREPSGRIMIPFVIAMVVFAAVYFPLSPLNSDIGGFYGGYYNGNHQVANDTMINENVVFLHSVLGLIPQDGSVLTQDNIPQLSGREYVQPLITSYNADIPYDYLLMDLPLNYFAQPQFLIPIANADMASSHFRIVAEGCGALLLEANYSGRPMIFRPMKENVTGSQMTPEGSGYISGTDLSNNYAVNSSEMFSGPGMTLLPGSYNVTFYISSRSIIPTNSTILSLQVYAQGQRLGEYDIFQSNFSTSAVYSFTVHFTTGIILQNMDFMGIVPSRDSSITLHWISISQLSAQPL